LKLPPSKVTRLSLLVEAPILGAIIPEFKLTIPLTEKALRGELVPIPTLRSSASTKSRFALPLPSTLKSTFAPGLLITVSDEPRSTLAVLL
jgi:hypothetical protein